MRSELNGRDVFSSNGGRGLSFEEVPSELMAGVDIYKNPSAEIIEGGLGGTVNLRTRMPFDEEGRKVAASVDYNYGDFAKQGKPSASVLFSDRWQTGIGEVGFLANLSYSELATRSDGIQVEPFVRRNEAPLLAGTDFDHVYIPGGVNWRTLDFERKRQGAAFAVQWRPNDDTEFYTQYLRSQYNMQWRERAMVFGDQLQGPDGAYNTNDILPAPGTKFAYDKNGVFQSGYATRVRPEIFTDWGAVDWGSIDWDRPLEEQLGDWQELCCGLEPLTIAFRTNNRLAKQETVTSDWSAGFRHFITDKLVARGDFQYVKSSSKPTDFTIYTETFLRDIYLDLTGKYPSLQLADGGQLQNPANYSWLAAMDNMQDNRGEQVSGRVDFEYSFDDSNWLRFARFGVRLSSREQVNKDSGWDNWQPISATWATLDPGNGAFGSWDGANELAWLDKYLTQYSELHSLGNFFRGDVAVPGNLWYPTNAIMDPEVAGKLLPALYAARLAAGGAGWLPATFRPQDTNSQEERTQAAYGMLFFENDSLLGGRVLDGNVGVRIVKTSSRSEGFGQIPNLSNNLNLTQEVRDQFDGSYFGFQSRGSYTDVLPSLNTRVRLTDTLQWRFAASKAIARPDFRLMMSWLPLTANIDDSCQPPVPPPAPGTWPGCGIEYVNGAPVSAGNPNLQPMRANQFDTALEWYFGPTNMLYATLFYKDVKGYFVSETRDEEIDGITYPVTRPQNLDSGKIQGFELGYNQFFDFLPGWMKGFGVQANYTFVDSEGGRNPIVDPNGERTPQVNDLPLEGLSRRSYNVVGIYETGPWSIRLAYNWRSRYLLTASEANLRLPIWQDDFGQLDGSFFYNINKNVQIGLQANNLTDSVTKLLMGPRTYPDGFVDEKLYPRAYFMNDRRYSAVLRARW